MDTILLCQHCGNKTSHSILKEGYEVEEVEVDNEIMVKAEHYLYFTQCNNCKRHSLFYFWDQNPNDAMCLWPEEKHVDSAIPANIKSAYEEAVKVKHISKVSFVILIRRSIEILCKEENAEGFNLYTRIKSLGSIGKIPFNLVEMADVIRSIGNEAAHDSILDVDEHEVEILDEFFTAIIEYLYVAPYKIASLKQKLNQK